MMKSPITNTSLHLFFAAFALLIMTSNCSNRADVQEADQTEEKEISYQTGPCSKKHCTAAPKPPKENPYVGVDDDAATFLENDESPPTDERSRDAVETEKPDNEAADDRWIGSLAHAVLSSAAPRVRKLRTTKFGSLSRRSRGCPVASWVLVTGCGRRQLLVGRRNAS